jgi:hypothetical protein
MESEGSLQEELLAPHPTPKPVDHCLLTVHDCLFGSICSYPSYLEAMST